MFQSWCNLTFLHWRYPPQVVRERVPPPLEIEPFDGSAYVGVIPFHLRNLRAQSLPALPWISQFAETNCRTYVLGPSRALAVAGARMGFGLPYAWARMRVNRTAKRTMYESHRIWPDRSARARIVVEPGEPITPQPLDLFLTARFRLYSFLRGKLVQAQVEHPPWPLHAASLIEAQQTLTEAAGLPQPAEPPSILYSPGVDVRVGRPEIVG